MICLHNPSLRLTGWAHALALCLALAVAACAGGSGSSGFDLRLENRAIDAVLDDGTCTDLDGFIICAADGEGFSGPTPGPGAPDSVVTNLDPANQTPCGPALPGEQVEFMLCFSPAGFAPTATFRVAARSVNPNGPWRILPPPIDSGDPTQRTFALDVPVPMADTPGAGIQLAVLVFFTETPDLPDTVDTLGSTGAVRAFVTAEVPTP